MATRKTGRKIKAIRAKALSDRQARAVKGGGADAFVKFGDIQGEKDQRHFIEMMMPKR
ncbi:MAG TPA: hypothetical protein VKJ00_14415 [Thermoanaerobaculia bacterium]|nr:hypothetical protein [Thermoanaerobaculia bacterium]